MRALSQSSWVLQPRVAEIMANHETTGGIRFPLAHGLFLHMVLCMYAGMDVTRRMGRTESIRFQPTRAYRRDPALGPQHGAKPCPSPRGTKTMTWRDKGAHPGGMIEAASAPRVQFWARGATEHLPPPGTVEGTSDLLGAGFRYVSYIDVSVVPFFLHYD